MVLVIGAIGGRRVAYMAAHWVLEDHDGLTALEPKRADNMASTVSAEVS